MAIGGYYIIVISNYFINGYWWLFYVNYYKLSMAIDGYFIGGYWWLLVVKLS